MNTEKWIDVGALAALDAAGHLDVEVDDLPVTIVRAAGRLHAFEDRCSHDGEPLAGAEIDSDAAVLSVSHSPSVAGLRSPVSGGIPSRECNRYWIGCECTALVRVAPFSSR